MVPLGVAALALAVHGHGWRERLRLGALAGLAYYGPSLFWLTDFSAPGYVVVALLESALLAAAVGVVPAARSGGWAGGWWALPAALVLLEAVQTRFPLGGFPLAGLSLSQLDGPFAAASPLGGSLLVVALAAASGVAVAAVMLVDGDMRGRLAVAGATLGLVAAPVVASTAVATPRGGSLDAVVVQGGGPRGLRAVYSDPGEVTDRHLAVAQGVSGSPDLVLLPENVVTVDGPVAGSAVGADLAALAQRLDAPVVVGVVEREARGFRNAAVLWGPDGRVLDRYEKEHRVPFGEYIPARDLLERLSDATALVPRDAIVGEGTALLESPAGPLGVAISYEVFFADRVREAIAAGGQVLLVPTNAASYVGGQVPAAEVAAARLRAREFGRAVLQAAPTGYSVVILPDGQVVATSRLGQPAVLAAEVPLRTGLTPYARSGDAPALALAVILLFSAPAMRAAAARRKSTNRRAVRGGRG